MHIDDLSRYAKILKIKFANSIESLLEDVVQDIFLQRNL